MIEALLAAVRNGVRKDLGYDVRNCEVMDSGQPPPACGDIFAAVHQGGVTSDMQNALDEWYDFAVTLTQRVTIPLDRVGDEMLAKKLARKTGFNRRAHALKVYLHMAWGLLQDANQYIVDVSPDAPTVYGFCEPAHFESMDLPVLVGGEWFAAEPEAQDVGLKAELRFAGARRLQALGTFT